MDEQTKRRKLIGLLVMVFGIMLGGFLTTVCIGIMIAFWRVPESPGYEGNLKLAAGAAIGALLGFFIYKLGVRIADRLPS